MPESKRVLGEGRDTAPLRPWGEREGPIAQRWEGEVGIGNRSGIPHLTPALSAPGGGEGVLVGLPQVFGLALALGRGELLELFLGHRLVHRFGGSFQLEDLPLAALGRERGARRLLLCLRFCR